MVKRIIFSIFLVFVVLTSSVYFLMPDKIRIDVENTRTKYSVYEIGSLTLAATEYVNLYDGTTKMRAIGGREITYWNDSEFVYAKRTSVWKDNITTIQTYTFDKDASDVENLPLENKFECFNCEGKIVHYEIRDILYDGETKLIESPFSFGHNMKIEWEDGAYYSKVFQQKVASDKIIIKYRPQSNYEDYFVRLFDPVITEFNNSLSEENLTFSGDENITRYLSIPKSANVTSALMNFSGFEIGADYCYQETSNVSTLCGGLDAGNYSVGGLWIDGDWDTYNEVPWSSAIYVNYTKPANTFGNSLWQVKDYESTINLSLPFSCWSQDPLQLNIRDAGSVGQADWGCYNGSSWIILRDESNFARVYEEAMNWAVNGSYTNNSWLELGTPDGIHEWNHTGEFNETFSPNQTLDLSSSINSALNSGNCDCTGCFLNGTNCIIPFLFHSDSVGVLEYSTLEINYDPFPFTELVSPINNSRYPKNKTFVCNVTSDPSADLTNITLYIWNSTSSLTYNISQNISGNSNSTTFNFNFINEDVYHWNCLAYNNESLSDWANLNWTIDLTTEDFNINITPNTSFDFIPDNNTHQGVNPVNQTALIGGLNMTNNLTKNIDIYAKLNETDSNMTYKIYSKSSVFLPDGLVGYWNFNLNANDISENGNDGVSNGSTFNESAGIFYGAYEFNGINNSINCGNDSSLNPVSSMSISSWVKIDSFKPYDSPIVFKGYYVSYNLYIYNSSDYPNSAWFNIYSSNGSRETGENNIITAGQWHNIVATYNGTMMKLFVDGVEKSSANYTYQGDVLQVADDVEIGASTFHGDYLNGTIDEVRIYDRALNQTEITQLAQNTPYSQALEIDTDYQKVFYNLTINESQYLWSWADYNTATHPWFPELEIKGVFITWLHFIQNFI